MECVLIVKVTEHIKMTKEMKKQSNQQRIDEVITFYLERGVNKESVNNVYRKIIKK